MKIFNPPSNSDPILGILSIVLAHLGFMLVFYFASAGGWDIVHPRWIIVFAQYLLLALLGSGLATGIAGLIRRERPRWPSITGLVMTMFITGLIALFFNSLDD